MYAPERTAKFVRTAAGTLTLLCLTTLPAIALAAGEEDMDFGPSWKAIFGWGAIGLAACAAVFFLAKWIYGVCLEANWKVDFALGLIVSATALAWVSIGVGVYLFLYNWPQPWTRIIGYADLGLAVVVLLVALFGRKYRAA